MNGWERSGAVATALGFALALGMAAPAWSAEGEGSMHDLIVVLKERGVIDEGDYESIAAKNAAYEAKQAEDRKPALSFWGDFRGRYEAFVYDRDETGVERTNRHRARYRFRLNGKADINPRATVFFRVASGGDDARSTNQTLGSGLDFDTDDLRLDLAYARISPFVNDKVGENGKLAFEIGKVPNPYTWKKGKDFMLWDGDLTFEGASIRSSYRVNEVLELFASGGYYILDENSTAKDPHLWAIQTGFHAEPTDGVAFGGRTSYFHFDSLDPAFHLRGEDGTAAPSGSGGNLRDGLSGGVGGQNVKVVEATGYVGLLTETDWPVLIYGTWANNLTAEQSSLFPNADQADTAWGAGVELGDKKKFVKVGVGYWHIEANSFPSQFIDSDLFDGRTNREGWAVYGSRSILRNTDLNLTFFFSDEIEDAVPPYGDSVPNADRMRVQADVVFKFK